MKILVTGFDPFGGQSVNPAYEAVHLLPEQILGAEILKACIPTVFGQGADLLEGLLTQHQPDAVLLVGQAGGRSVISVERVAINVQDASIADNAGNTPVDQPVVADGPDAYFATLPIKKIVKHVQDAGIPCKVGKVTMFSNGRTVILNGDRGFMKVLAHAETRKLLGVQLMCSNASDMIGAWGEAIANGLTPEELRAR